MTIYYATKKTVVNGTQVAVTSNVDVTALYNSVIGNTYNFKGIQIYSANANALNYPLYFNILDSDGNIRKEVIGDLVLSPSQRQNTIIADIDKVVDINNYFSTTIRGSATVQYKLFHMGSISLKDLLKNKN